jgi:hypothetical protein
MEAGVEERATAPSNKRATAAPGSSATDGGARSLWFTPPLARRTRPVVPLPAEDAAGGGYEQGRP